MKYNCKIIENKVLEHHSLFPVSALIFMFYPLPPYLTVSLPPSLPFTARTHSCQLFSLPSFHYHTSLYLANFPPPCIPYSFSLNSNPYQDLCFAFLVCYEALFLLISKIPVMTENVYSVSEYFLNFCVSSICQFVYFLCDCTFVINSIVGRL